MSLPYQKEQLFERMPILAAVLDRDGHFLAVSDKWVERIGYTAAELRGRAPHEIATPESAIRFSQEYLPGFRRTGKLDHVAVGFIAKDGTTLELLMKTRAVYDDDQQQLYSISVFFDTSALARAERRYEDLYHATPAMLHTVDPEGRLTDVSDHWLEKMGYEREDVIGRSVLDFLNADANELSKTRLKEIFDAGNLKNVPRQMVTRSGGLLDVLSSAHTEVDKERGVRRLLVATKDMTDRNRAEAKLREAYGEIAQLKDELERERDYLREEVSVSMNFGRIIGESPALGAMLARIEAVADTPANVLIVGETGTGKELVAHAIHSRSRRADAALVKVNCASIPHELFESEFFGHAKGAFTGAYRDRVGRFQLADGGTIFLDEVGEIPLELQGKLLRVLQEREFERVGEDTTRQVDVRVIAATNRDLEKEVEAGNFREDLFYRLSVFPVQVPPLRKRGDDVIQIAVHFLEQICRDFGRPVPNFTQTQVDQMRSYDWPGNIRELKNVIERAVILSRDHEKLDVSLPTAGTSMSPADETVVIPVGAPGTGMRNFVSDREMKQQQRENIRRALEFSGWRVSGKDGAAELLGMKPSTLADRMRSLGLEKPANIRRGRRAS